jgi:translation initiation factor IF-2
MREMGRKQEVKKLKAKSIALQYHVELQVVLDELAAQGIALNADGEIGADFIEITESHFADFFSGAVTPAPKKKSEKSAKGVKGKADAVEAKEPVKPQAKTVTVEAPIIVKAFAEAVGRKPNEVISDLIKLGELAGINQAISEANARKLCKNYGFTLEIGHAAKPEAAVHHAEAKPKLKPEDPPEKLVERPPVVTFLGHVDHGKTSLQDAIRQSHVVDGEAGKITQHIGASTVTHKNKQITFIDTPGHEAFTSMRARGANATDIAVLVVSASEGFKAQTIEAMNHALAAKVPIIVAMNKIDLPDADPDKILLQMQQNSLFSEDWGGEVGAVRVSAKTGQGLPDLLDRILLEAELLELRANPKAPATGVVLEAQMESGLGPIANVLIQNGTLRVGDIAVCGECFGKVRSLISDKGVRIKSAGPSTPVKVIGLSGVPGAGDFLSIAESEKAGRQEVDRRIAEKRGAMSGISQIVTAEDLFSKLNSNSQIAHLNLIIKSDVRGSGEAIEQSLAKLPSDKIRANVVLNAVGPITENDIMLASASSSTLVGFHVRVNPGVNELAKRHHVEIRLYSIIYELIEDISDALAGKLEPEKREKAVGRAKIMQVFEMTKGPKICGCMVESGSVRVGAKARVFRGGELIYNGTIASLRRFHDDVKEVKNGLECGIRLDNFNDFDVNDEIEVFEVELKKATL